MQLRLCDMCKRNIVGDKYARVYIDPKDRVFQTSLELCHDCYDKLHGFMLENGVADWEDEKQ